MKENKKQGKEWEKYVRTEINSYLDTFLPETETGNIGIKYSHPVKARYETGPVYDENKICGVEIRVVFNFMEDLPVLDEE